MPASTSTSVNDRVQTVLDATGIPSAVDAHASDIDRVCGAATVADSTAVTNTTTETALDKALSLSAGDLAAGRTLRVDVGVDITAATSTPNLTLKVYVGDKTDIAGSTEIGGGVYTGVEAGDALCKVNTVCRTAGASGTFCSDSFGLEVLSAGVAAFSNITTGSVDTTADVDLFVTVEWSAAAAGNSCKLSNFVYSLIGD